MKSIGQNIRILREARNLSSLELGTKAGIEPARYVMLEDGSEVISALELQQIAFVLQVSTDSLLLGKFMSPVPQKIKMLALDVDGVMTDGGMYFTEEGDEIKKFNTKDGRAVIRAIEQGIEVVIVSSGSRIDLIQNRANRIGVRKVYVGKMKKVDILEKWMKLSDISWQEVACIGDDVNDLEMIDRVGFSACPSDAATAVLPKVDAVLATKGGQGCIREFVESFLFAIE